MSRDPYCMTDRAEGNVQPSYIFAELCTCKTIFAITQDRIAQERFGIEKSTFKIKKNKQKITLIVQYITYPYKLIDSYILTV